MQIKPPILIHNQLRNSKYKSKDTNIITLHINTNHIKKIEKFKESLKTVSNNFYKKYKLNPNVLNIKQVNSIVFNQKANIVALFKDYLIYNDYGEFLKRYYKFIESEERLAKLYDYYENYSKIFPNYIILPEAKFIYKNILKKQRLIDTQQILEANEIMKNKNDDSSYVFNSKIYESIMNISGSYIQQSIDIVNINDSVKNQNMTYIETNKNEYGIEYSFETLIEKLNEIEKAVNSTKNKFLNDKIDTINQNDDYLYYRFTSNNLQNPIESKPKINNNLENYSQANNNILPYKKTSYVNKFSVKNTKINEEENLTNGKIKINLQNNSQNLNQFNLTNVTENIKFSKPEFEFMSPINYFKNNERFKNIFTVKTKSKITIEEKDNFNTIKPLLPNCNTIFHNCNINNKSGEFNSNKNKIQNKNLTIDINKKSEQINNNKLNIDMLNKLNHINTKIENTGKSFVIINQINHINVNTPSIFSDQIQTINTISSKKPKCNNKKSNSNNANELSSIVVNTSKKPLNQYKNKSDSNFELLVSFNNENEKNSTIKNSEIFNVPVNLSINTKNKILENKEYSSTLNYNSTALQSKNNKLGKKIFSNSNNQNLLHISSNNSNNINKEVNEKTKLNLNDLIKSSTDSVCYINNASDKNKILTSANFKKQLLERNKKSTNSQYNKNKIFDGISKFSLSSNFNQLKNSDKCVNNAYTTLNSNYSNLKDLLKKFDRKSKNSNSSIQTKDMKKYSINSKNLK